jgi:hypothetical protein
MNLAFAVSLLLAWWHMAGAPPPPVDPAIADVLWLPEEAVVEPHSQGSVASRNGRSVYVDRTAAVAFTITIDRERLSGALVEHFAQLGWRQRQMQHVNPQRPTSFASGWRIVGNGLLISMPGGRPLPAREPYYQWRGEWEEAEGNLLEYAVGGEGREIRGRASYAPRIVAAAAMRRLRRIGWMK